VGWLRIATIRRQTGTGLKKRDMGKLVESKG
jgi:hypothetical protein